MSCGFFPPGHNHQYDKSEPGNRNYRGGRPKSDFLRPIFRNGQSYETRILHCLVRHHLIYVQKTVIKILWQRCVVSYAQVRLVLAWSFLLRLPNVLGSFLIHLLNQKVDEAGVGGFHNIKWYKDVERVYISIFRKRHFLES